LRETNVTTEFGVKDVESTLARQTLLDADLVRPVNREPIRMLPWLDVVVLGGRSVMDRGGKTVGKLVGELRKAMKDRRLLVLTGPGVRGRHALGVGLDLGLPTGVLTGLVAAEAETNGHMLAALLAAEGVSYVPHATAAHQLATHLAACPLVVSNGYPPCGLYEPPPPAGKLPRYGSDAGALLLADTYGANRLIYVKDVAGIQDSDGKTRKKMTTGEADKLRTLPVERTVLELLERAKHVRSAQIINGLDPGALTRALAGKNVGTTLKAG
jgi:molybdenum storage protein